MALNEGMRVGRWVGLCDQERERGKQVSNDQNSIEQEDLNRDKLFRFQILGILQILTIFLPKNCVFKLFCFLPKISVSSFVAWSTRRTWMQSVWPDGEIKSSPDYSKSCPTAVFTKSYYAFGLVKLENLSPRILKNRPIKECYKDRNMGKRHCA